MSCSTYTIVFSDGLAGLLARDRGSDRSSVVFAQQHRARRIVVDESVHLREPRMPIAACAQNPVKCFLVNFATRKTFAATLRAPVRPETGQTGATPAALYSGPDPQGPVIANVTPGV